MVSGVHSSLAESEVPECWRHGCCWSSRPMGCLKEQREGGGSQSKSKFSPNQRLTDFDIAEADCSYYYTPSLLYPGQSSIVQ